MGTLLYITLALICCTFCESSRDYSNYHSSSASLWQGFNSFGAGGPYTPVPVGPRTSEGYHVDPHLLEKIKHILLKDEIQNGPEEYSEEAGRIVGIEVIDIQQSVELAQYHQTEGDYGLNGYSNHDSHGYTSNDHPNYYSEPPQPPSNTYGFPKSIDDLDVSNRSSSYDVPIASSYELASSSGSKDSFSYDSAPVNSALSGSDPDHSSYSSSATVHGPPDRSSYEEPHSLNRRKARRTLPYSNKASHRAPYRPTFYSFRY